MIGVELILGRQRPRYSDHFLATIPESIRGEFWEEFKAATSGSQFEYRANVHWRIGAFRGKHINVSEDCVRRTVNRASPSAPTVFMLGGSTMWGFHSPDDQTIPSLVARRLIELGTPATVVNHGQIGFVATQEAVYLGQLAGQGKVPAVAVFLDGLNEIDVVRNLSNQSPRTAATIPGLHYADVEYQAERARRGDAWRTTWAGISQFRLVSRVLDIMYPGEFNGSWAGLRAAKGWTDADERRMTELAARGYQSATAMAEGLGGAYDFEPLFYWQPTISRKKALTEHERPRRFMAADRGDHFPRISAEVTALMADNPRFRDISGLFDEYPDTAYTDGRHYTLAAKKIIADRIAKDVSRVLQASERVVDQAPAAVAQPG